MAEEAPDRRVGRPSKLNADILRRLIEMHRLGASQADACRYAGINPDTLRVWLLAGREELALVEAAGEGEFAVSDRAVLALALDRAQGEFVKERLELLLAQSRTDPTISKWLLERRFPDDWGRRDKVEHTHHLDEAIERLIRERGLDEERAAKLRDFVAERKRRRPA